MKGNELLIPVTTWAVLRLKDILLGEKNKPQKITYCNLYMMMMMMMII